MDAPPSPQTDDRPGYDRRMTKEEINILPVEKYEGPIHLITTRDDLVITEQLRKEPVLGFDIEIKPAFSKGESHPPALLQLAGTDAVCIFQLSQLKLPRAVRALLADPDIIKAGVAPGQDIAKLKELGQFKEAGFTDLATLAKQNGIKNFGLRGLAAVLFGFRISKGARVSNWARADLTETQIHYAATDAW
ncbi:MAG: 3'-5' exonuclease domain-containing protein 2, partial [Deltaproteobacteria bacterium]|nr:3'-5' exonuclease domain-containing protein 2 [Deltaproteobacteria bacterium]